VNRSASKTGSVASPARNINILSFRPADININGNLVKLSQASDRFISLITDRCAASSPPVFICGPFMPFPNNNVLTGFIENPISSTDSNGRSKIELPVYIETGISDGQTIQVVDGNIGTAKGRIQVNIFDTNTVFEAMVPMLSDYFDSVISKLASDRQFSTYPWACKVIKLATDQSSIVIDAGTKSNIQKGNLLGVYKASGNPPVYERSADIIVDSASDNSSTCGLQGTASQPTAVGDLVML